MFAFNYKDEQEVTQVADCSHRPNESYGLGPLTNIIEVPPMQDKLFRGAWEIVGDQLITILAKAKGIGHGMRRAKRSKDFEPFDDIIRLDIPGQDMAAAEIARANIRNADAKLQTDIDGAADEAALRVVIAGNSLV